VICFDGMLPSTDPDEPVRHHYVPRGYLAPFTHDGTTKRGRLWVFGRDAAQPPVHEPLMRVAFEPHMYTVLDEHGNPSPALERHLRRNVEEPFLAWHRGVVRARRGEAPAVLHRMTRQQFAAVARYVLYQHLRTPAHRLLATRLAGISSHFFWTDPARRAELKERWRLESPRAWLPLAREWLELEFEAWLAAMRVHVRRVLEANPHLWLRPIDRFAEVLVPTLIEERAWRLVELPADVAAETPLITCDNPVVLARSRAGPAPGPELGWDVDIGGGWGEPGVEMTLALSPRHALMIAQDPGALGLADDPDRFAASVRVRTARHALQHVYARGNDPRVAALLRATPAPDVVFEVGDEMITGTVDVLELSRRVERAGATRIGVRYTA
jgi:hypothetical protein